MYTIIRPHSDSTNDFKSEDANKHSSQNNARDNLDPLINTGLSFALQNPCNCLFTLSQHRSKLRALNALFLSPQTFTKAQRVCATTPFVLKRSLAHSFEQNSDHFFEHNSRDYHSKTVYRLENIEQTLLDLKSRTVSRTSTAPSRLHRTQSMSSCGSANKEVLRVSISTSGPETQQ